MAGQKQRAPAPGKRDGSERIILTPADRRPAVLDLIRTARRRLQLSLFRCDDFQILDALAEAIQRGVNVEVLLTGRARGWEARLDELNQFLESMGATVHRYPDSVVKYHAKYMVADDGPALVGSASLTRKCLERTSDFMLATYDREVVSGLRRLFTADCLPEHSGLPRALSRRLIVGPERARQQFAELIGRARQSIRIIDHRVTDPSMKALLAARRAEGIKVKVLMRGALGSLVSHGRLILVDDTIASIGSISLSALSLDFRREVAIITTDPRCVAELAGFFETHAARRPAAAGDGGPS